MRYFRRRPRTVRAAQWMGGVPLEGMIIGSAQISSRLDPYVLTVHGPESIALGEWVVQDCKTHAYEVVDDWHFRVEYKLDPRSER